MTEQKAKRTALGRGLSAIMADVAQTAETSASGPKSAAQVSVDLLRPNPNQPRREFRQDLLEELAASIGQKGVIQPLIVRPVGTSEQFEIVAGERRWRAAQLAGLHTVPVIVRPYSDEEMLEIAIIENVQRSDLGPLEEAQAYRQLMDRFGHTQEELAKSLSRSRSHIANLLRLLGLPASVQEMLRDGRLTAGHARALITSDDPARLAQEVVRRGLSVREAERLSKLPQSGGSIRRAGRSGQEKDADTRAIEADLSANLGMKVEISHRGPDEGGTIVIHYRTLEDLDLVCDVLSKIPRDLKSK